MEGGDIFGNGSEVVETFQKVQNLLDQNRLLINEINQNQESKLPLNLTRNVSLITELNNNVKQVLHLYAHLSNSMDEAESTRSKRPGPPA